MAIATVRDLTAGATGSGRGACGHDHTEMLGSDGPTEYLRCGCGTVLVVHRGRTWILRPAPS